MIVRMYGGHAMHAMHASRAMWRKGEASRKNINACITSVFLLGAPVERRTRYECAAANYRATR